MGYTTDFSGSLELSRPLTEKERDYINLLSDTRRMKRDVKKLMEIYKGEHGYPFATEQTPEAIYGHEGEYFACDDGNCGQKEDDSILNFNCPPGQRDYAGMNTFNEVWDENQKKMRKTLCQPGLWCQWKITDDGKELEWDGGEKFYNYVEWLKYLIQHFFEKWGVYLDGEIEWIGEDSNDRGIIVVKDNIVKTKHAEISFIDDEEE